VECLHKFQKHNLLILINAVAGLSIFFFGYDQGMMGGVNNAKAYMELLGFGYTPVNPDGISATLSSPTACSKEESFQSITWVP
jgi:hypothetical protein